MRSCARIPPRFFVTHVSDGDGVIKISCQVGRPPAPPASRPAAACTEHVTPSENRTRGKTADKPGKRFTYKRPSMHKPEGEPEAKASKAEGGEADGEPEVTESKPAEGDLAGTPPNPSTKLVRARGLG